MVMRCAVLLLVFILVVDEAIEVAGYVNTRRSNIRVCQTRQPQWGGRKRRAAILEAYDTDSLLPEKTYMMLTKRAYRELTYPRDCNSATLRNAANKCGLNIVNGPHFKVCDPNGGGLITSIPHSVHQNGTCRAIIRELNSRCL